MFISGRRYRTMKHISTFLWFALVIAIIYGDGATAQEADDKADQVAEETKTKNVAVTIVESPKYVNQSTEPQQQRDEHTHEVQQRPPHKPPIKPIPDKPGKLVKYVELQRPFYGPVVQKVPPRPQGFHNGQPGPKAYHNGQPGPQAYHNGQPAPQGYNNGQPAPQNPQNPNNHKYPKVIPLKNRPQYYHPNYPRQQLVFAASTGKPFILTAKSPKFSLPVQTINGIPAELVRPPKFIQYNTTSTTTTTTTPKPMRNKRIWPKHILDKKNGTTAYNDTKETLTNSIRSVTNLTDAKTSNETEYYESESKVFGRYVNKSPSSSTEATTRGGYRRVTRVPKHKPSTTPRPDSNFTMLQNDWVPIVPHHYPNVKRLVPKTANRRSDSSPPTAEDRRMMYLQSYGLIPLKEKVNNLSYNGKKISYNRKPRHLSPYVYSGSSSKTIIRPASSAHYEYDDLDVQESRPRRRRRSKVITKIKHHHHHHHHKYLKTVEKKVHVKVPVVKPVPYPVEKKVPVPYAVEKLVPQIVEKRVPYPVHVEKKVPYPVPVRVPHPVPYKVIEKQYVPKPYPIIHHIPVLKHVEVKVPHAVPVQVEKRVPYPVEVKVPVDRPVPYPVEKKVPYPVPVKVYVPQPYPVEKKVPVPYEVKVKEEVIKHIPFKVPVPTPFAVQVPVEVEKKVPYPVEVEKQIPVPFKVYVPQPIEVEKKVPVYVPKPYPVEKKVPYPVRVPYPVKVPVKVPYKVPVEVPVGVPVYLEYNAPGSYDKNSIGESGLTASGAGVTSLPEHYVTLHGTSGFTGHFSSRSDNADSTTPIAPSSDSS